jgi:hypothetical protein
VSAGAYRSESVLAGALISLEYPDAEMSWHSEYWVRVEGKTCPPKMLASLWTTFSQHSQVLDVKDKPDDGSRVGSVGRRASDLAETAAWQGSRTTHGTHTLQLST